MTTFVAQRKRIYLLEPQLETKIKKYRVELCNATWRESK